LKDAIADVIKRRKLQLFGHICRMKNHHLAKLVSWEWQTATDTEADRQEGGHTKSQTGAVNYYHYHHFRTL